jgi:AcrR family transcriptional regulator
MPRPVTRKYDASGRRAAAERSRTHVMEVARDLFARLGLDRVTIEMLAAEAGVSAATFYGLFKSKVGLLRAMMEASLFNERYQALVAGLKGVDDPVAMLTMTAAIARAIYDGERAQLGVVRGAAAFSAELREIEQQFERIRLDAQRARVRRIARAGTVRAGLTPARVRDILWMFTGRDVYRMLVVERGWSPAVYEAWLAGTLVQSLLAEPVARPRGGKATTRVTRASSRPRA